MRSSSASPAASASCPLHTPTASTPASELESKSCKLVKIIFASFLIASARLSVVHGQYFDVPQAGIKTQLSSSPEAGITALYPDSAAAISAEHPTSDQTNQAYLAEVLGVALTLIDALSEVGNSLDSWLGAVPSSSSHHLRRLLNHQFADDSLDSSTEEHTDDFPHWVSASERKLLQASPSALAANVIVAKDGSGTYTTVTAAVNAIPLGFPGRYVIYIKKGVYKEVLDVTKDQKNVTFVGDGIHKTIITGNRNVASGDYNTFRTATVGIAGNGFFGRDLTFRNTVGPSEHQAVALRAGADYVVFYRCSFEGYQDTLYALSSRQFYRECQIHGTVDFIFGNAIAVFQNCLLVARLPMKGQQNTYTAQGRQLEVDVSGYSFHNCTLKADANLTQANYTMHTYLGRPWKEYSRTVFIQSKLQALVHPKGWLPWNASNPYTDMVYYGEYGNRGGGARTSERVSWKGVHPNMSKRNAS
ncbi:hypothetical protein L7F22_053480 [Adiantum nelumboides]|nr:hypothetical protein [Adiantum nelumboides]